jgi:hypothetical protein
MNDDTPLPFDLPAVRRKKLTVDFNGGNQSSDAGLLLLREAEREFGACRRLAAAMPNRRDPDRIRHAMFEVVMARVGDRPRAQGCDRPRPAAPRFAHEGRGRPLSADRGALGVAIDHLPPGECAEQDRSGAALCGVAGAITAETIKLYLLGLPLLLVGLWSGFKLYGKLDDEAFRRVILFLLLLSGLTLAIPISIFR